MQLPDLLLDIIYECLLLILLHFVPFILAVLASLSGNEYVITVNVLYFIL